MLTLVSFWCLVVNGWLERRKVRKLSIPACIIQPLNLTLKDKTGLIFTGNTVFAINFRLPPTKAKLLTRFTIYFPVWIFSLKITPHFLPFFMVIFGEEMQVMTNGEILLFMTRQAITGTERPTSLSPTCLGGLVPPSTLPTTENSPCIMDSSPEKPSIIFTTN